MKSRFLRTHIIPKKRKKTSHCSMGTRSQSASSAGKTPRRFHRLTHDRNKIWYYTYVREQY